MRNSLVLLATVAALIGVAACNRSEESAPPVEQNNSSATTADHSGIMKARHENFEKMGDAMKAIGAELKADAPTVSVIQRNAALIAGFGPELARWFPEGSGPETGRKTRAKAEIWSDPETFRQRASAFEAESARFNQAAQSGDVAAIRAAQPRLGESCKNCHDRFRAPEH